MKPSLEVKLDAAIAAVPEREIVLEWILDEWNHYSNEKFGFTDNHKVDDHDADMAEKGWDSHRQAFWPRQVLQYMDRARMFTVGEQGAIGDGDVLGAKGRQAAMKMATTLLDGLGSMIRQHGLPPAPGHTSGDVLPWDIETRQGALHGNE